MALEPVYRAHYVEHLEAEIDRLRAALECIVECNAPSHVEIDALPQYLRQIANSALKK